MAVMARTQQRGKLEPQQRTRMPSIAFLKFWLGRTQEDSSTWNRPSISRRESWNSPSKVPQAPDLCYEATTSKMVRCSHPDSMGVIPISFEKTRNTTFLHLLRGCASWSTEPKTSKWEINYLRSLWSIILNNYVFTSAINSLSTNTTHHFSKHLSITICKQKEFVININHSELWHNEVPNQQVTAESPPPHQGTMNYEPDHLLDNDLWRGICVLMGSTNHLRTTALLTSKDKNKQKIFSEKNLNKFLIYSVIFVTLCNYFLRWYIISRALLA